MTHLTTPARLRALAGSPLLIGPLDFTLTEAASAIYGGLPDSEVIESLHHFRQRAAIKILWPADAEYPRKGRYSHTDDAELGEALRRELLTRASER
jgi:hypothetical protein